MTDLDTALRAADFHVPDAAKVIRKRFDALQFYLDEAECSLEAMTDCFNEAMDDLAKAEYERDALRELLDEVRRCFSRDDDLPANLLPRIDSAIDRIYDHD